MFKGSDGKNEAEHDHDFNRVHDAQLHDTHELSYEKCFKISRPPYKLHIEFFRFFPYSSPTRSRQSGAPIRGGSEPDRAAGIFPVNPCVPTSRNTLRSHYAQIWAFSDFESNLQALGRSYVHGGYSNRSGSGFYVRLLKRFNFKS